MGEGYNLVLMNQVVIGDLIAEVNKAFLSIILYLHNTIQIHNNVQFECEKYPGIFYGILSVPQDIVMDLKKFMSKELIKQSYLYSIRLNITVPMLVVFYYYAGSACYLSLEIHSSCLQFDSSVYKDAEST